MSLVLAGDKNAIAGMAQDGRAFVVTRGELGGKYVPGAVGSLQDTTISFNQRTVSPGSTTDIKYIPALNSVKKHEAMYLSFRIHNTGVNNLIVLNPYDLISNLELKINDTKAWEYDEHGIKLLIADYLSRLCRPEVNERKALIDMCDCRDALNGGMVVASNTYKQFDLSLFALFPCLNNWISNSRQGIRSLGLSITFRPSTGTLENCSFVRSSTPANAYDATTISFTDIQLRTVTSTLVDRRLIATVDLPFFYTPHYGVLRKTGVSWNVPGTDQLKVLLTDFPKRQLIKSLYVMIRPTGLQTGYDSADCGKWLSGARYINFAMTKVGYTDANLDFSLYPHRLDQWQARQQTMVYGEEAQASVVAQTDGLSWHWHRNCFMIDFRNVDIANQYHELVAGLDSFDTGLNMEFTFTCREAIHTNCEIILALESQVFTTLDGNGMPVEIKTEKLIKV